jgi:hypothetical protein
MSHFATLPLLKKTEDEPNFQTVSPKTVGVPCTARTSSLVEPMPIQPGEVGRDVTSFTSGVSIVGLSATISQSPRPDRVGVSVIITGLGILSTLDFDVCHPIRQHKKNRNQEIQNLPIRAVHVNWHYRVE